MDLRCTTQALVGTPIGVGGRIYKDWDELTLKGVSDEDAEELLSLPNFQALKKRAPPDSKKPKTPKNAPQETKKPATQTDEEPGFTEAGLRQMTVEELLEFFDETVLEQAKKLNKDQLVETILKEAS